MKIEHDSQGYTVWRKCPSGGYIYSLVAGDQRPQYIGAWRISEALSANAYFDSPEAALLAWECSRSFDRDWYSKLRQQRNLLRPGVENAYTTINPDYTGVFP
jgi:hypothetical protein